MPVKFDQGRRYRARNCCENKLGHVFPKRVRSTMSPICEPVLPIPTIHGLPRRYRRVLLQHARVFQHVCPLPAGPGVAVLEVLAEVVCTVEFLA